VFNTSSNVVQIHTVSKHVT